MNSVYIIFFIKILTNKEYKMSQANDILDFIKRNCKVEVFIKGLKDGKNLGITALEIQNEYGILRNNASSILNLLCKNGKLVKINSRPVTFIDKEILNEMNKKYNVPIKNIYTFNELREYILNTLIVLVHFLLYKLINIVPILIEILK